MREENKSRKLEQLEHIRGYMNTFPTVVALSWHNRVPGPTLPGYVEMGGTRERMAIHLCQCQHPDYTMTVDHDLKLKRICLVTGSPSVTFQPSYRRLILDSTNSVLSSTRGSNDHPRGAMSVLTPVCGLGSGDIP